MAKKRPRQIKNPYIRYGARAQGPYTQNLGGGDFGRAVNLGKRECFLIVSAQIGDPWPDQIYITYNEPFNDTTCSVALDWTFLYQSIPFDNVAAQAPVSATVDSWLVENTLESKDGASPEDPVTLSYTPGTCAKDGDATCALGEITNYSVNNQILGPTSLEIGNVADNIIVVDYPVDMTSSGAAGTWSAENLGGPLTINNVSIASGNIQLLLSAVVAETDQIFVTHDPPTSTANSAQGTDGRYSYKFFGREATNNVDTTPPTVPTGLTATTTGTTTIDLSWNPSTDVKSGMKEYVVYRASIEIARVAHPTTTYQDTGLSPATAYSYTVSAVDNANNESAESASDSATTWQTAPNVTAAEVGNVADNIIAVTFDKEIVATDYVQGWSFTEDTSPVTISSALKTLATEVQFTLSADISNGTTVAYNYNATSGNYENTDGVDMENQSGSVANNVAPPVTGPDFVAFAADTDGLMRGVETGSGSITFGRATIGTVVTGPDKLIRDAKVNEIRFKNARRGENLCTGLVTETIDVVNGAEYQLTIAGGNGDTAVCSGAFTGTLTANGTNRISWPSGTPKTATTTSLTITVTGTLTEMMLEEVTGDSNQNPGEYIPAGEVDGTVYAYAGGVRYYNYRKGNTVDGAGVVTEAKGTALTDPIYALYERDANNEAQNSEDFTQGTWSKNDCTIDGNVTVSPRGRQDADRLNVTPGSGQITKVLTTTAVSGEVASTYFYLKDDGAGFGWVLFYRDANFYYTAVINLTTGVVTDTVILGVTDDYNKVEDAGNGWWRLEVGGNFGGIASAFSQAGAVDTGTPSYIGGAQPTWNPVEGQDIFIYGGNGVRARKGSSHIKTPVSSLTRTADDGSPSFAIANYNQTSGTRVARVRFGDLATGDEALIDGIDAALLNMLTMQDGTMKSSDGTGTSVSPSMGTDPSKEFYVAVNYVNGQDLEVGFRNITDSGTWQWAAAPVTYDGAFPTDNNGHVAFGQTVNLEIAQLHGYLSAIGKAQIESTY